MASVGASVMGLRSGGEVSVGRSDLVVMNGVYPVITRFVFQALDYERNDFCGRDS
jgi:hypothetical protein